MRSLALIAIVVAGCYYYHQQHPASGRRAFTFVSPPAALAVAATPVLHYHSPLDAGNTRGSSGYYSTEPAERYETTGPKSTASGRAALAQAQEARSQPKLPVLPVEP